METRPYDLVVIGAGPAGERGALTAAGLGKRVAVVERGAQIGGAGVNTGTIPSKTLRETALALSGLRARRLYGVDLSLRREATIGDFMFHERHVTQSSREYITSRLLESHVDTFTGTARFVDPHTVDVACAPGLTPESFRLRAEVILIATGSSPARPPQFPFEHDRVHDSNEILELKELPKSLAVVGAGVIGSE